MSIRALEHVFGLEATPDGVPIKQLGRTLLALIAGYFDEETQSACVPVLHVQLMYGVTPALALRYCQQLEQTGIVAITEETDEQLTFELVDLPPLDEVPGADELFGQDEEGEGAEGQAARPVSKPTPQSTNKPTQPTELPKQESHLP